MPQWHPRSYSTQPISISTQILWPLISAAMFLMTPVFFINVSTASTESTKGWGSGGVLGVGGWGWGVGGWGWSYLHGNKSDLHKKVNMIWLIGVVLPVYIVATSPNSVRTYTHGLVQERRNSSALAMESRISRTNPTKWETFCIEHIQINFHMLMARRSIERQQTIVINSKWCWF